MDNAMELITWLQQETEKGNLIWHKIKGPKDEEDPDNCLRDCFSVVHKKISDSKSSGNFYIGKKGQDQTLTLSVVVGYTSDYAKAEGDLCEPIKKLLTTVEALTVRVCKCEICKQKGRKFYSDYV